MLSLVWGHLSAGFHADTSAAIVWGVFGFLLAMMVRIALVTWDTYWNHYRPQLRISAMSSCFNSDGQQICECCGQPLLTELAAKIRQNFLSDRMRFTI